MTEEELVADYRMKEEVYYAAGKEIGKYFMPLVKEMLDKGDIDGAKLLMRRCPDIVTQAFMMDAINVKEGKYDRKSESN